MISLHPCPEPDSLPSLRTAYLEELTAPLDGMWDTGFISPAPHYELRVQGQQAGYCVVDGENGLTRFFVMSEYQGQANDLLDHVLRAVPVHRGLAFTQDPLLLSLCLDRGAALAVHSYLYEESAPPGPTRSDTELAFRPIEESELAATVALQLSCLGGGSELTEWLNGYSADLIARGALFLLTREKEAIGLGELRRSPSQPGVADVGVMVAPTARRQGWGTDILRRLRHLADDADLRTICSTTLENRGAQRAISQAGFVARHRLLSIDFQH